jgi:autotransporter strand-loop-strand O-heptosyltransferase
MNVVAARAPLREVDAKDSPSDVVSIGAVPGTESGSVRSVGESVVSDRSATSTSAATPSASILAERAYPPPAEVPTQRGARGIQFDFNDGCRVQVPPAPHRWRVRLSDLDTGNVLYQTSTNFAAGRVSSTKRYFVRFRLEVWADDDKLYSHDYDARGCDVLVLFPVGTLGDALGWFPYAVKFKEKHGCRLTCAMAKRLIPLFADAYPEISFVTHDAVDPKRYYATYRMGLFFDDTEHVNQPCDFRHVGLHRTAGHILGVDPTELRPCLAIADQGRPIPDPYVVIATQATTQCKYLEQPRWLARDR